MEVWLASSPSVQVYPGDTLALVCNITQTAAHLWTISHTMVTNQVVTSILTLPLITGFEFNGNTTPDGLVSTVKFNVNMSHTVTCVSATDLITTQETNVTMLGKNV